MNPIERIAIWQAHLATYTGWIENFKERYEGVPAAMQAKLRANIEESIRNCEKNIKHWTEKAA